MPPMRTLLRVLVVGAFAAGCASSRVPPAPPSIAPAAPQLFDFRADLWPNLHQLLFHEALLPREGFAGPKSLAHRSFAPMDALSPDEGAAWRAAVGYYGAHFTTHSMFTDEFMAATRGLTAAGSAPALPPDAGVAAEWRALLGPAGAVYRARFWPAHDATDRAYAEAMRPLVAAHGAWLASRLAAVYQTAWPTEPVLVEVTPVVAPFGAATLGEPPFVGVHAPLITISSNDPGYAGDSGLEMLFHEASHLLVDKVEGALDASAKRQGRTLPRGLWHFVIFYTAGHVTQERLGPSYLPYAERQEHHIFDGDAAALLPLLQRTWQPYLDGRTTLDAAIDAIVAGL
jgi:hypothetical protein